MPFDPGRGGSNGGGNFGYSNPYTPQQPSNNNKNNKNFTPIIFILVGVLVFGLAVGAFVFINMNKTPSKENNANSSVDSSKYVEVEIFDVNKTAE